MNAHEYATLVKEMALHAYNKCTKADLTVDESMAVIMSATEVAVTSLIQSSSQCSEQAAEIMYAGILNDTARGILEPIANPQPTPKTKKS